MSKRPDIEKKVNDVLESINGIQRAEPAPFLFTRVKARLEREQHNVWETAGSYLARPAIAFAGLFFILCVNAYILYLKDGSVTDQSSASQNASMLVEEYALTTTNNNYDYENIEP